MMAMQTRRDAGRSGVSKGFHGRGGAAGRKTGRAAKSGSALPLDADRDEAEVGAESESRSADASAKQQRRRLIDPTTCERDYSADEVEFMKALDEYKRKHHRNFPTCSEILEVLKGLGYRKEPLAAASV